ncbi:MAG: hypothetical protein WC551_02940 [Patescibacteria group bacterium]
MRIQFIGAILCAALFGAGCTALKPDPVEAPPQSQPENRVTPLPPSEPIGTPLIPEAARNVPRPEM